MNGYKAAYKIQKEFDIPTSTLRFWESKGKIRSIRLQEKGKRYYNFEDVKEIVSKNSKFLNKDKTLLYARVSSRKQSGDLERQKNTLKKFYPDAEIIQDIGSTLNYKRPGLRLLLDRANKKEFSKLVILYRDRLCRFSFDLFEYIFKAQGIQIEVISLEEDKNCGGYNFEQELATDLLSVITYFTAKNNGKRSSTNKKRRNSLN